MWARNFSNHVKTRGSRQGARSICSRLESVGKCAQCILVGAESPKFTLGSCLRSKKFYHTVQFPPRFGQGVRHLSSHDCAEVGGEEGGELDEGFSELDVSGDSNSNENSHIEDDDSELLCEPDMSDEDDVGRPTTGSSLSLDMERHFRGVQSSQKRWTSCDLSGVLLNEPKSVNTALDKYLSEGKNLENSEISHAMSTLASNQMYSKALQYSERLEAKNLLYFNEQRYASQIDLIAKNCLEKAERFIESIPKSFRGEVVYSTLLVNCVSSGNLKKAEQLFNKMKQSSFATSANTCNQMILLYKRFNKKKIADVLLYMDEENIEPTLLTYRLLIDTKGMAGDMAGMDQIVEMMKAAGIEPDLSTKITMAKHYFAAGFKEKAELCIEESNLTFTNPLPRAVISAISLFATMGKADEVERIWKICEREPRCHGWIAVMSAWGKLKQIDKAEAVFDKLATQTKLSTRHYTAMLLVYAHNKMLNKAKVLMRRMGESGCQINAPFCDALVKLYAEAGEVEKADSILERAATRKYDKVKPLFSSYLCIIEKYGEKGDVHNSEKILHRMRQAGYPGLSRPFQALLQAYANSNSPAYGFTERMKADNVYLNEAMKLQLSRTDPFKEPVV